MPYLYKLPNFYVYVLGGVKFFIAKGDKRVILIIGNCKWSLTYCLPLPHSAGAVGVKELFKRLYLFEQLFAFVRVLDTDAVPAEILQ